MANDKNGPIIEQVRWLDDSSGIAFLAIKNSHDFRFHQLLSADIETLSIKTLTPEGQNVDDFDIRGDNYVYRVSAPQLLKPPSEPAQPAVPMTGKALASVLSPEQYLTPFGEAGLWAVLAGKRIQVSGPQFQEMLVEGHDLSLSPDGRSLVATYTEKSPPESWKRYKVPPGTNLHPATFEAYYLVDLQNGISKRLVDAPSGRPFHWNSGMYTARWSANGRSVLLPNTFLPFDQAVQGDGTHSDERPCAAVLRLGTGAISCVLALRAGPDPQRFAISDVRFENDDTVNVYFNRGVFKQGSPSFAVFRQESNGAWKVVPGAEDPNASRQTAVEIHQDLNRPPLLVVKVSAGKSGRTVWDPNPQIQNIELGQAEVIEWKDQTGFEYQAGLVKPPGYVSGRRYPLVIQTHGFNKDVFLSNGVFTTAFAARSLSSAGMVVVQMGWNMTNGLTPKEGPDQVVAFESLVAKLDREGLVDPSRVGIIGFSRSVFHVLEALAIGRPKLAAATVSDGVTQGYFEYILSVDFHVGAISFARQEEQVNGGKPFTEAGRKSWLTNSPEFNLNKVEAPLLLVQPGLLSVLVGWEPYAVLRYLNKPVDLIMLEPGTHEMTNPRQRLLSENINVDWFRFWLQDYEDPDPGKLEQYKRWRELHKLQDENEKKAAEEKSNQIPAAQRVN
jgi:dipeptidyl aminopeptidase/acylaminoacyl peptidase